MVPFHLRYTLSRRQRFAAELLPWVPVIAGSLGFTIGVAVLAVDVSLKFLALLLIPLAFYPRLLVVLFDLTIHSGQAVEVFVDDSKLEMKVGQKHLSLPLDGIIQVFRADNAWTVLHFSGAALSIPADVITDEQIEYLKTFARIAAAERKAAQSEH
ncbi:MAG TPA: hypothetical protein VG122_24330 [Gemmata sp.]|nr:hypothetical protein [Gemmata sp.]